MAGVHGVYFADIDELWLEFWSLITKSNILDEYRTRAPINDESAVVYIMIWSRGRQSIIINNQEDIYFKL